MQGKFKQMSLSDRFKFIKCNIDLLNVLIVDLVKKRNYILNDIDKKGKKKIKEEIQINNLLLNYYHEIKSFYEQALFQFYSIINSDNDEMVPFFIKCWEKEFDALKDNGKFDFHIIDVDKFVYKKVK